MSRRIRSSRRLVVSVAALAALAAVTGFAGASGIARLRSAPAPALVTPPLVPLERLAIFDRPQTGAERMAAAAGPLAEQVGALTADPGGVPADELPGRAEPGTFRLVLTGLGPGRRSIFVVRTTKGRECGELTDFAGGCLAALPANVPLDPIAGDPDGPGGEGAIVWGVTRNDVRRVEVVVDGRRRDAVLGRNAYFFELGDASRPASAMSAVVATLADGRTEVVPVETAAAAPEL